jgi:hypothetical protein
MERKTGNAFLLGEDVSLPKGQESGLNKTPGSRSAIRNTTARGTARMPVSRCTKMIAISPFTSATKQEILDFIRAQPKALIVLPGNQSNTPSPRQIQRVISTGAMVFAEGAKGQNGRPAFIITKSRISKMPSQVFARKPTADNIEALAAILPHRTIRLGRRRATFFICGELIAFNPDGRVKHNRKLDYDIIINPAHSIMGHWNHLDKKLTSLSCESVAVYVTNNDRNHHLNSDIRIYKDGVLKKRNSGINIAWSECPI